MRILCIEDSPILADLIKIGLQQAGFAADNAATGEDGLAAIAAVNYDAIVLDLSLPDLDGLFLLQRLRTARNPVPVLILSARVKPTERVAGLEAGADDYVPKPFDMKELVARLRALLRRPVDMLPVELRCGNLAYRPNTCTAVVNGKETTLSRREASLLQQLLRNAGRPVSKSMIEDRLYPFGEEIASNAIEVHVHYLRRRLAALQAAVRIHTVRGTGYVLCAEAITSPA